MYHFLSTVKLHLIFYVKFKNKVSSYHWNANSRLDTKFSDVCLVPGIPGRHLHAKMNSKSIFIWNSIKKRFYCNFGKFSNSVGNLEFQVDFLLEFLQGCYLIVIMNLKFSVLEKNYKCSHWYSRLYTKFSDVYLVSGIPGRRLPAKRNSNSIFIWNSTKKGFYCKLGKFSNSVWNIEFQVDFLLEFLQGCYLIVIMNLEFSLLEKNYKCSHWYSRLYTKFSDVYLVSGIPGRRLPAKRNSNSIFIWHSTKKGFYCKLGKFSNSVWNTEFQVDFLLEFNQECYLIVNMNLELSLLEKN